MQLKLDDVPKLGLDLDYLQPVAELGLDELQPRFAAAVQVHLRLLRIESTVNVQGVADTRARLQCSRCLEGFELPLRVELTADFNPEVVVPAAPGKELELSGEELDGYSYTDERLPIDDFVREQLILALPMVPICRADCRGLCAHCGANLNQGPCPCPPEADALGPLGEQILRLRKK